MFIFFHSYWIFEHKKARLNEKMFALADLVWTFVILGSAAVMAIKLRSELKTSV
jgi:hypothetical protein